jgi:hypothetical protein
VSGGSASDSSVSGGSGGGHATSSSRSSINSYTTQTGPLKDLGASSPQVKPWWQEEGHSESHRVPGVAHSDGEALAASSTAGHERSDVHSNGNSAHVSGEVGADSDGTSTPASAAGGSPPSSGSNPTASASRSDNSSSSSASTSTSASASASPPSPPSGSASAGYVTCLYEEDLQALHT